MDYNISLDSCEGSIELLHSRIKSNEIDIVDVPLARIFEEYLEWIKTLNTIDLDTVGDFLAVAAHLLLMKVRVLLPVTGAELQEELEETLSDGHSPLQIIEQYRTFRGLAEELGVREKSVLQHYTRPLSSLEFEDEDGEEVSLFELLRALQNVIQKVKTPSSYEVALEEISLESKVKEILKVLASKGKVLFEGLFTNQTRRIEMIVTFVAVLELVKTRKVFVKQEKIFGDIWVHGKN